MTILVVCTGNTCRSPMAEGILRHVAGGRIDVASAGTATFGGQAMAHEADKVLQKHGIRPWQHRSQPVSEELLVGSDEVWTMTAHQRDTLRHRFPRLAPRIRTVAEAAGEQGDVEDPVGQGQAAYDATYEQLETLLKRAVARLQETSRETVRIGVGSDHAGFRLKRELIGMLQDLPYDFVDVGTDSDASTDYPDFAKIVAEGVCQGDYKLGILICGTGIGMSIAANKVAGVRAANCSDPVAARLAREHNDANVLTLGERLIGVALAEGIARAFLGASFQGGRHLQRVRKIEAMEYDGSKS